MTLAAIQKLAIKLPPRDRMKLADALWESVPTLREPSSIKELERRAEEVESGAVKALSSRELDRLLKRFEGKIQERRFFQRGRRPAAANSKIKGVPLLKIV